MLAFQAIQGGHRRFKHAFRVSRAAAGVKAIIHYALVMANEMVPFCQGKVKPVILDKQEGLVKHAGRDESVPSNQSCTWT
jgi:hypothetical protein